MRTVRLCINISSFGKMRHSNYPSHFEAKNQLDRVTRGEIRNRNKKIKIKKRTKRKSVFFRLRDDLRGASGVPLRLREESRFAKRRAS